MADIFITGATGVLGRATVPLLINAGYTVRGLARSGANEEALQRLGAEARIAGFTETGGRGIVLRMGSFYGPQSSLTQGQLSMARHGISPFPGSPKGYTSSIWIEDAASAVVAALDHLPAGVYDVVDDEPLRRQDVATILAGALGRRTLRSVPPLLFRLTSPPVGGVPHAKPAGVEPPLQGGNRLGPWRAQRCCGMADAGFGRCGSGSVKVQYSLRAGGA